MSHEPLTPTVTIHLQPIAYQETDPTQRAAWDSFWGELIRSVLTESHRFQQSTEGSSIGQRRVNDQEA